jgi:transposase
MDYIEGSNRNQLILFPQSLDEYISEDNPVRFIDAFVESLDLKELGFRHSVLQETGRPPYHPSVLLKLYVYGYLNRIRSSRLLEKEANRNVEVIWLTGRLAPDHKTIANFRRDNGKAVREVCRAFTRFCRDLDLFGGELVAIDGSKFKAVNNKGRNFTDRKLKRTMKDIDKKIDAYLQELDENDAKEPEERKLTAEELKEKIKTLRERMKKYKGFQKQMEESGETQISLTDPDSRSMPVGGGRTTDVAYNVQMSVDEKHKMIVDHEVTNEVTDRSLLRQMSERAKEALGVEELDVLADMGYYDGQQVKECIEEGITPYIHKADTSANRKLGLFAKDDFRYDPEQDCYWCPSGEKLTYRFQTIEKGRGRKYYATPACSQCKLKSKCTRSKDGRRITRWVYEEVLEEMEARVQDEPDKVKLRKTLAEHPFGTIKRHMDQGYFLMRGLPNVGAEMSLTVLAYNIKRAVRILGVQKMVQALV